MKSSFKFLLPLGLLTIFYTSCSEYHAEQSRSQANPISDSSPALPDTSITAERAVIKTADINMEVERVEPAVQSFQQLVNTLQGHVFHCEIKNEKTLSKEVQHTLDSNLVLNEIHPTAMLKVKVPTQYGDTFIASVLKMNGRIASFMFDENDVTEDLTANKELMLGEAGQSGKPGKFRGTLTEDAQERRTAFIDRKATFSRMQYQTKNLWFDIYFAGKPFTERQMMAAVKTIHEPFYVSASHALQNGWYGLSMVVATLLNLWPLFILAALLLWVLKKVIGFDRRTVKIDNA